MSYSQLSKTDLYLTKMAYGISMGHNANINIQRRELTWYPLWGVVMTRYFDKTDLMIGSQWPLWRLDLPTEKKDQQPRDLSVRKQREDHSVAVQNERTSGNDRIVTQAR